MRCKIFLTLALSILLNMLWTTNASAQCAIISNPNDTLVCAGLRLPFKVTVSGTVSAYQWQEKTSSGWIDLVNDWYHSGVTTATMVLYEGTGDDGKKFRCVITTPCGILTSTEATLSVFPFMRVVTQPVHDTVCEGGTATFFAAGSGIGTLRYQWYKLPGYVALADGGSFSGTRTSTLTVSGVTSTMNGNKYYCVMQDTCTGASTLTATLTVVSHASFVSTITPMSNTVCAGGSTSFTTAYSAAGVIGATYQWFVKPPFGGYAPVTATAVYSGVNTATLNITGATAAMNGYKYYCQVSTACGVVSATPEALLFVPAGAIILSGPRDTLVCAGLRLPFKVTVSGTVSAYQWQEKTSSGWIDLVNDWYHSGVTTATMVLYEGTGDDGKKFRCVVTTPCGILTSAEATLSVFPFMRVTAQPVHDTVCVGGTATFSAAGSGIGTLRYQWYKLPGYVALADGGSLSGTRTSTLTVSGVTSTMNGNKYYCVMRDTCTGASTLTATLTVNMGGVPAITRQPADRIVCSGTGSSFTVATTGTGLTYQWQVDDGSGFTDITGLPYIGQNTNTLIEAYGRPSMNGYRFRCAVSGCGSVYSDPATYTVYSAESFSVQPVNTIVCESGTTSFTASVPGALSYMWFENTGSGFRSIVNGSMYSGNGTGTLTITGAPASLNGATYECRVASSVCGTLFSDTAMLVVGCDTPIYYGPGSSSLIDITAHPNPTSGTTINISSRVLTSMDAIMKVLNRFGQVVITNNVRFSGDGNITIDISNLPPGVYTANITTGSITKSLTFVKQ